MQVIAIIWSDIKITCPDNEEYSKSVQHAELLIRDGALIVRPCTPGGVVSHSGSHYGRPVVKKLTPFEITIEAVAWAAKLGEKAEVDSHEEWTVTITANF